MIRITTIVPPTKTPAPARKAAAAKIAAAPKVASKRPAKSEASAKKSFLSKWEPIIKGNGVITRRKAPKQKHEADTANEAMIADAVSFKVSLFLGRGAYDRSEVSTLQLAANRAAEMKAAHPDCTREVMVHGITAAKRTMLVPPALLPAAELLPGATIAQFRASAELLAEDATTTASPLIDQIRAAQPADDIADIMAETAGTELVGVADIVITEQSDGSFTASAATHDAIGDIARKLTDRVIAGRKARASATAIPEPAAADVPTQAPPSPARPVSGKRAEALAAAERGELPQPPDFSAETHKNYRKRLEAAIKAAEAGDLAWLEAEPTVVTWASSKAFCRYRDLCIVALKARKATVH